MVHQVYEFLTSIIYSAVSLNSERQ